MIPAVSVSTTLLTLVLVLSLPSSDGFCPLACECNEEVKIFQSVEKYFDAENIPGAVRVLRQLRAGGAAHHSEPRHTAATAAAQQHQGEIEPGCMETTLFLCYKESAQGTLLWFFMA